MRSGGLPIAGLELPPQRPGAPIVIRGCRLFDGDTALDAEAELVVRGDRIEFAGPIEAAPAVEAEAAVLDAAGLTAMPGLIDAHNHSTSEADMRAYIRNGVTTVRFAGRDPASMAVLREQVAKWDHVAPRLLSCGPLLDAPPTGYPEWTELLESPAQARSVAERLVVEEQVDALIVTQRVTLELVEPIVDVAREHGVPVVGQTWALDARQAALAGIDQLENTSRIVSSVEWPPERLLEYGSIAGRLAMWARAWVGIDWDPTMRMLDAMVEAGVAYCPTMVAHYLNSDLGRRDLDDDPQYHALFSESERAASRSFLEYLDESWSEETKVAMRASLSNREEWLRRFHAAGGSIIAGTDTQFGGLMLHAELRNLGEAGLGPGVAVRAATSEAATTIGRPDLGHLRAGARADVLLVEGDPLVDLSACRRIRGLICRGELVPGPFGDRCP